MSIIKRHTLSGTTYTHRDTTPNTYNSTWRWNYASIYENAGAGEVSGYCIDVFLQNTQWTDYYNDGNSTFYRTGSAMTYNNRDTMGPTWHIQAFLGLDDGHTTGTYSKQH